MVTIRLEAARFPPVVKSMIGRKDPQVSGVDRMLLL
jgi:hypothetical protein